MPTYTGDGAKAVAILGNIPDAHNQVWHLHTHSAKLTGRQGVDLISQELNKTPQHRILSIPMMVVLRIFILILHEFKEMKYQYDRNYFFESSKFEERFGFIPTTPEEAVRATIKKLSLQKN